MQKAASAGAWATRKRTRSSHWRWLTLCQDACQVQQRELAALQHRVRVLVPSADRTAAATPKAALALLRSEGATNELGFLQAQPWGSASF